MRNKDYYYTRSLVMCGCFYVTIWFIFVCLGIAFIINSVYIMYFYGLK